MQLTDTLAHHVEAFRGSEAAAAGTPKVGFAAAAGTPKGGVAAGAAGTPKGWVSAAAGTPKAGTAAAGAAGTPKGWVGAAAAGTPKGPSDDGSVDWSVVPAVGDSSLIGCLSRLREPTTGQLFTHEVEGAGCNLGRQALVGEREGGRGEDQGVFEREECSRSGGCTRVLLNRMPHALGHLLAPTQHTHRLTPSQLSLCLLPPTNPDTSPAAGPSG